MTGDQEILRYQFLVEADNARQRGMPDAASDFEALAASTVNVPDELLAAHAGIFEDAKKDDTTNRLIAETEQVLRDAIYQRRWLPAAATEYLHRFVHPWDHGRKCGAPLAREGA